MRTSQVQKGNDAQVLVNPSTAILCCSANMKSASQKADRTWIRMNCSAERFPRERTSHRIRVHCTMTVECGKNGMDCAHEILSANKAQMLDPDGRAQQRHDNPRILNRLFNSRCCLPKGASTAKSPDHHRPHNHQTTSRFSIRE